MKSIIIILVVFLVFSFAQDQIKQNINKYQAYLQQWKIRYAQLEVTELKGFSQPGQMCDEKLCKFYYYTKIDVQASKSPDRNMTVLLIGGLKGTDSISQKVLLQSYGVLKAAKIIYFPIGNPSGYLKGRDLATPNDCNVQSDFPILGNTNCNQSVAFKILNYLFKTQTIDLTIYVHDGAPSFNYGWSNNLLVTEFPQEDIGIQIDIAQMVRYIGNLYPKDGQFKTGPLVDIKGGVDESIIDWIYGASRYPKIVSQYCKNLKFTSDTEIKMNGLAFSLKVGSYNPESPDRQMKNIKRAVQILKSIIEITNPFLSIKKLQAKQISISLNGCKIGSLTNMKLFNEDKQLIYEKQSEYLINGNVMYGSPNPNLLKIPINIDFSQITFYQIQYTCGDGWMMNGQTRFAQLKRFKESGLVKDKKITVESQTTTQNKQVKNNQVSNQIKPSNQENSIKKQKEEKSQDLKKAAMIALAVIGILWMAVGIKHTIHILKNQRIKNFSEKFESVERVEDLQTMQSQNEPNDSTILPELIQMKPNSQDLDQQRLNT